MHTLQQNVTYISLNVRLVAYSRAQGSKEYTILKAIMSNYSFRTDLVH